MSEPVNTITLDGKEYPLTQFSQHTQMLLALAVDWAEQLKEAGEEIRKAESRAKMIQVALAEVNRELKTNVEAEIAKGKQELDLGPR